MEMGFSACIGDFVIWMNAMSDASVVKYNCKDFSARMISLYNLQRTVKLQRQSLALPFKYVSTTVYTSSDLNYNSIPIYV